MSVVILLMFGVATLGVITMAAVSRYQREQYERRKQAYEELGTLNQPPAPATLFSPVSLATIGAMTVCGLFVAATWVQQTSIEDLQSSLKAHIATTPNSTSTTTTVLASVDNSTIQAHTAVTLTQAKAYTDTEVGALETALITQIATAETDANSYCDASISSLSANFSAANAYCDAAVAEVDISGANAYTDAAVAALSTNFTAATMNANDYTDAAVAALSTNFTAATDNANDYCDASISSLAANFTAANDYCDVAVSDLNAAVTAELNRIEALATAALVATASDGFHCWDLNHDNNCTLPTEDINHDGNCTVLDCQGAAGNSSFQCWDLDQDNTCDVSTEDKNLDGLCTTADCHGLPGTNGTDGTPGAHGYHCWDLNENRLCDLSTEDLNSDGNCTVADCTHYANGSIELNKVEGAYIDLKYQLDSDADVRLKLEGTGDLALYTGGDGSLKKAMTINWQQHVGIGLANPSYPLHVFQNTTSYNQMRVYSIGKDGRAGVSLYHGLASNDMVLQHAPTGAGFLHNRGGNLTIMGESIHIFSNDAPVTEAIHISTTGNIGFGMKHAGAFPYVFAGTVSAPTVSAAVASVATVLAQSNSIVLQAGSTASTGARVLLYGNGASSNTAYYEAPVHVFQPLTGGSTRVDISANAEGLRMLGTDHTFMGFYRTSTTRSGWVGFGDGASSQMSMVNSVSGGNLQIQTNGGTILLTSTTSVTGNIAVTGTVDGVDVSTFKSDYDAKVNQDVRTTASPSFANSVTVASGSGILANGNVELLARTSASVGSAGAASRYKLFFDSGNSDKLSKINSVGTVTPIEGAGGGSSLPASPSNNSFLVAASGEWVESTLANTKTILGQASSYAFGTRTTDQTTSGWTTFVPTVITKTDDISHSSGTFTVSVAGQYAINCRTLSTLGVGVDGENHAQVVINGAVVVGESSKKSNTNSGRGAVQVIHYAQLAASDTIQCQAYHVNNESIEADLADWGGAFVQIVRINPGCTVCEGSTLPASPASNSFLTGNGAGAWVESSLAATKTILGIAGTAPLNTVMLPMRLFLFYQFKTSGSSVQMLFHPNAKLTNTNHGKAYFHVAETLSTYYLKFALMGQTNTAIMRMDIQVAATSTSIGGSFPYDLDTYFASTTTREYVITGITLSAGTKYQFVLSNNGKNPSSSDYRLYLYPDGFLIAENLNGFVTGYLDMVT